MAQRTCRWRSRSGEGCDRQVHDQREYCIFHFPDKTDDEAVEFERALRDDIAQQLKEHSDYVSFMGFHFPHDINLAEMLHAKLTDSEQTIKEALFLGESFFHGTLTCHAVLQNTVVFSGATFEGDATFSRAEFRGYTEFSGAMFRRHADFLGAEFQKYTVFSGAMFQGNALFSDAMFQEYVAFIGATFQGYAEFSGAKFQGDATFIDATFAGPSVFVQARFAGTLRLRPKPCKNVGSVILLAGARFTLSLELSLSEFLNPEAVPALVILRECVFDRDAVAIFRGAMGCVSFFHSDLSKVVFVDEDWHPRSVLRSVKPRPRRVAVEEYVLEKKARGYKDIPPDLQDVNVDGVAQLYRRLRDNYEESRRYAEAGDFFIGEMEILRQYRTVHTRGEKPPSQQTRTPAVERRPLSDPYRLLLLEPYRILGHYGESIRRPVLAALILILLFTVVRPPLPSMILSAMPFLQSPAVVAGANPPPSATEILNATWGALLESVFAFFQLRAEGTVSLFERLLSVPILGLLFIAIRRKLERR